MFNTVKVLFRDTELVLTDPGVSILSLDLFLYLTSEIKCLGFRCPREMGRMVVDPSSIFVKNFYWVPFLFSFF